MAFWISVDPRTSHAIPYDIVVSTQIEEAYQKRKGKCDVAIDGKSYTINFEDMIQRNAAGGHRRVDRVMRKPNDILVLPVVPRDALGKALRLCDTIDSMLENLETDPMTEVHIESVDLRPFVKCYDMLLRALRDPFFVDRYGGNANDQRACDMQVLEEIPNYFANVVTQSEYRRKVFSLLGLRNLLFSGPFIFTEIQKRRFSGCPVDYSNGEGLQRMRALTGNTVDLDTMVMNVPVHVREINKALAREGKQPLTEQAYVKSDLCRDYVLLSAKNLIDDFAAKARIKTEEELKQRRLWLGRDTSIHVARTNMDRGRYPVWQYMNVGVSTFHVNVPNLPDVIGALLKSPFHLVKAFALRAARDTNATTELFCDFFDNAVNDTCFNGKWKAIEEFIGMQEQYENIREVIFRLQADQKHLFTSELFERDKNRKEESELMKSLIKKLGIKGKDSVTGAIRNVTSADVDQWIVDTN